jgi:acetoin utilization deacetylase AcuC-like enzyme
MPPIFHHPDYSIKQPENHPFPMGKFRVLSALLESQGHALQICQPAPWQWLEKVHCPDYLAALFGGTLPASAQRRIGFDCTPALAERCRLECGGTLMAVEAALQHGLAANAAGGTHHAHKDFGSGYCLLNDLAMAAHYARHLGVDRVLIIDLDVHQGDGTAALLKDCPWAFTLSVHCEKNFPHRKQRSDWDIGLERGVTDAGYLQVLEDSIPWLLTSFDPQLVLFDAGVDVHQHDRLGYLNLTDDGLYQRDRFVIEHCRQRDIPVAGVIGGGYDHDLAVLAARHAVLMRAMRDTS